MSQPKLAPVGLEVGDEYKTPFGNLEIIDIRGQWEGDEDNREWKIRDMETGEKLWVDWEYLMEVSLANLSKDSL